MTNRRIPRGLTVGCVVCTMHLDPLADLLSQLHIDLSHPYPLGGRSALRSEAHRCARSGHSQPPAPHSPPTDHCLLITDHVATSGSLPNFQPSNEWSITSPATLFHPWHANASANTSSPISTGAKRLRAPSAFRRIPPFRYRGTISIAGSKLVLDTAR